MPAPRSPEPADAVSPPASPARRALLMGALGGVGAAVAGAATRVNPVRAANGDPVLAGNSTAATGTTTVTSSETNGYAAIRGIASAALTDGVRGESQTGRGVYATTISGTGVYGVSTSGYGVQGASTSHVAINGYSSATDQPAIQGRGGGNSTGVLGVSGIGLPTAKPNTGVYGQATQGTSSRGVWGYSTTGQGVRGETHTGDAVYGRAWPGGHALHTRGRIRAEQVSGVATIPAGATGVTVTPVVNIGNGAFVLLTPRANIGSRGLWFTTNRGAGTFRIRMSAARGADTKVAWLLLG